MIREFKHSDTVNFKDNGLTPISGLAELYEIMNQDNSLTIEKNGEVRIMVCFIEYAPRCYYGFIVGHKEMNSFDVKELKVLIKDKAKELKAVRLETLSLSNPVMDKYHKFIGFNCEGIKVNYIGNGNNFKMWGMLWED